MGLLSRSTSITRYRVTGKLEGPINVALAHGVKRGRYRKIDSDGDVVGLGWTAPDDFTAVEFEPAACMFANYIALCLRVDTVTVSSRVLEERVRQEIPKLLEKLGLVQLSAAQRRGLKEQCKESLRKEAQASIGLNYVVWDTAENVVYFTGLSMKARERFEDHFKKSFGLRLHPLIPYIRALELQESNESIPPLDPVGDMDFLHFVKEYAYLGREFLTWLWIKSEQTGGVIGESGRTVFVDFLDRLALDRTDTDKPQILAIRGEHHYKTEELAALRQGKLFEEARFSLKHGDNEFTLTLKATWFQFAQLRTPPALPSADENPDDGPEARFLENVYLIETALSLVDSLFERFLLVRLSDDWSKKELPAMRAWVAEQSDQESGATDLVLMQRTA